MSSAPKGRRISEKRSRAILDAVRQGKHRVYPLTSDPAYRGEIRPHHLRPVYPDQTRRSNPIVIPLYDSEHEYLHANPKIEEEHRIPMLLKALRVMADGDERVVEAAIRGAIEFISLLEEDS